MAASKRQASGRITEVVFPGGRIVDGRFHADEGSQFVPDEEHGGFVLMLRDGSPGPRIPPCECALIEGRCVQVTSYGPDGTITDVWCDSDGCGFCVGGLELADGAVRLDVTFAYGA